MMANDYYPNIRTIVAVFFFAYWFFKEAKPFSIWWMVLIYAIDYIVSITVISAVDKMLKRIRS